MSSEKEEEYIELPTLPSDVEMILNATIDKFNWNKVYHSLFYEFGEAAVEDANVSIESMQGLVKTLCQVAHFSMTENEQDKSESSAGNFSVEVVDKTKSSPLTIKITYTLEEVSSS